MTVGVDGVERDPVRIGKCYACAYTFHIWICPKCGGPYIEQVCEVCHKERRHGEVTPPKGASGARQPVHSVNDRFAYKTARGEAFGETQRGWKGGAGRNHT